MKNVEYINALNQYIDDHKDEIINELSHIASIRSVSDSSSDIKPFGQGCIDALECMLVKGRVHNFITRNYENYVGSILYDVKSSEEIGIWAHLDVVPEGEGWMSDPYVPVVRDGFLFGRGVGDNKSAAIGSLYIMKAIRDLNIPMKHNIKLMLGTSEETGMEDVEYFVKNYPSPKFSFVPDAGFPGACGEFGRVQYQLVSKKRLTSQVKELHAGSAFNIIPNVAKAVLVNDGNIKIKDYDQDRYTITINDEEIRIEAKGKMCHAAWPEGGDNAIYHLTKLLSELEGLDEENKKIFEFFTLINEDYYGGFFDIKQQDDISGQTISSGTVLRYNDGYPTLLNDCRHCVTDTNERIIENICLISANYDFDIVIKEQSKPYHIDVNGKEVQAITRIYQEHTGDTEHIMRIGKGGTYAGQIPNAVATGICMWGSDPIPEYIKPGHGGAHQPDEFISISGYMEGIKLFAKMLLEIDDII